MPNNSQRLLESVQVHRDARAPSLPSLGLPPEFAIANQASSGAGSLGSEQFRQAAWQLELLRLP